MNQFEGAIVDLPKVSASVPAQKGVSGNVGAKIVNIGEDGATFIPNVSAEGVISWSNDKDLPNPEPVNIKGEKGDTGKAGYTPIKGIDYFDGQNGSDGKDGNGIKSVVLNADYTLTLNFDDRTSYTTPSIRGATGETGSPGSDGSPGKDGSPGADGVGIASVQQTTTSTEDDGNNVITVTLTNGTKATFTVQNGSKGSKGDTGSPGTSGVSATHSWNDTVLTITSASGTSSADLKGAKGDTGADGRTPVKGTDYYTEADKAEMVAAVRAQLITEQWTFTLMDDTVITKDMVME